MLQTNISKNDFIDQESQVIFETKKNFYETGNWNYLIETISKTYYKIWDKVLSYASNSYALWETLQNKHGNAVIFGAGQTGKLVYFSCHSIFQNRLIGFIDNYKYGSTYCGLPVNSVNELLTCTKESLPLVLIPDGIYASKMKKQLEDESYPLDKIFIIPYEFSFQTFKNISNIDIEHVLLTNTNQYILYGTSHYEFLLSVLFKRAGRNIIGVCDPNYSSQYFHELPVISLDEAKAQTSNCFILCQQERIAEALVNGISKDQLIPMFHIDHLQYFDSEIVPKPDQRIQSFVDGGALGLETAISFLQWCNGNVANIYSFEPDENNYKNCLRVLNAGEFTFNSHNYSDKVKLYKKGLWSCDSVLEFQEIDISGASYISDSGCPNVSLHNMNTIHTTRIPCCSIDEVVGNDNITFIKMDIEGSELEALKGAKNTIKRCRPILAISVYHKPEDIVEIPSYIKSLIPEYRLFLRCYHTDHTETVLYAI